MSDITPNSLPFGIGAFQINPSLNVGKLYDTATGLYKYARLITPTLAQKGETGTIEIVYKWNPNSTKNRATYKLNFHDIEASNMFALGIERFDVVGDTRKSVQQTMGKLNIANVSNAQNNTGGTGQVTSRISWSITSQDINSTDGNGNPIVYNTYTFDLSTISAFTENPIDITQFVNSNLGSLSASLSIPENPKDTLGTNGYLTGEVGWWLAQGSTAMKPILMLYFNSTFKGGYPTAKDYQNYVLGNYIQFSYYYQDDQAINTLGTYTDTIYVDTWATAPDRLIIVGVCEMPQGYEIPNACLKFDAGGSPMTLTKASQNQDHCPTEFFKALEYMYYLNNHPESIRRGDVMYINDFARNQQIPVTFKSRSYPMSIDRPFLAPFQLEFIALQPLYTIGGISNSSH